MKKKYPCESGNKIDFAFLNEIEKNLFRYSEIKETFELIKIFQFDNLKKLFACHIKVKNEGNINRIIFKGI